MHFFCLFESMAGKKSVRNVIFPKCEINSTTIFQK